jgi:1-deoxy-D-xylulose-5-phosphate synthase
MVLPDRFLDHDAPLVQYDKAGLNAAHIVAQVLAAMGQASLQAPARA